MKFFNKNPIILFFVESIFKQKWIVILFVLNIISAFFILELTHQIRILNNQFNLLKIEKDTLDHERNNLLLEEKVVGNIDKIKKFAQNELNMKNTNQENETIILIRENKK